MFITFVDIDWACHMWLTRNHMFIHEICERFTSFVFWNFEISKFHESELGKFILNSPLKNVITTKIVNVCKPLDVWQGSEYASVYHGA